MASSKGRFNIYADPDEEAFQRSLLGADGSASWRQRREPRDARSPLDRRTAQSKVSRFLTDSAASLAADCPHAEFVPFRAEFPAYEDMDEPQTSYYLFWRREALDGHFLASDEGYVLLLCFELINRTLLPDPDAAAALLFALAEEYAPRFPQAGRCLPRWIEDFYSVFISAERLYADLDGQDKHVADLFDCGRLLGVIHGRDILDYEGASALTAFSEKRSLFANNWEQTTDFRQLLPLVFKTVDGIYRGRGTSLILSVPIYSRRAFPEAIYAGDPEIRTTVISFAPGPQRDHFSRIARLTELLMAQRMGYGNKRMTANVTRIVSQIDDAEITDQVTRTVEEYFA